MPTKASGNKPGRPKKSTLAEIKDKRTIGRPKGTAAIINEYRDRMLASPKSAYVLEKIYEVALNDEHPGQMAAMKLVLDRIVPVSTFDATKNAGGIPQISINISTLGSQQVETVESVDYEDAEVNDES